MKNENKDKMQICPHKSEGVESRVHSKPKWSKEKTTRVVPNLYLTVYYFFFYFSLPSYALKKGGHKAPPRRERLNIKCPLNKAQQSARAVAKKLLFYVH